MLKRFADRVAVRPWSFVLGLVGSILTAMDGWWLITSNRSPSVRVDPGPLLLGIPVMWIAIGVFLIGPICLAIATYRLLGGRARLVARD